jgi:uncharacterized protein
MRKYGLLLTGLLLSSAISTISAQQKDYQVVFDITSADTIAHKTVIRQVSEILNSVPDANLEVVLYSQSIDMVLKKNSVVSSQVAELASHRNVSFKVCAVTMKRKGVEPADLIPGVTIVPDGIYEIITKQRAGWGYIKIAQ